ncbi:O-acetyl-ADP-ribose deacetylase [Spirochaetia bacterium]|nr:O-acetyl-ADP-ribose deacetylase [Spirochaetia bacterium]
MINFELVQGDITKVKVDAIVSAGNATLVTGGGTLDQAVHKAAGPELMDECVRLRYERGGVFVGEAVIVDGFMLPAKKIILTTGPMHIGGGYGEPERLAECYRNCLLAASEAGFTSIAFPNISCGSYAYPKKEAAEIALKTLKETADAATSIQKIIFVCLDPENYNIYKQLLGV